MSKSEFDDFTSIEEPEEEQLEAATDEEIIEEAFEQGLAKTLNEQAEEKPTVEPEKPEYNIQELISKANRVDDLEQQLTKLHDKAFGTIGQLKQTIDELKTQKVGRPQVTKDSFKALAEYFDDDAIAEAIATGFSNIEYAQPVNVDERINQVRAEMQDQFELKLLTVAHPDWEEIKGAEEFSAWIGTLKPEAQETLNKSRDSTTLIKALNQFKTWRNGKQETEAKKQARLENAIPVSNGQVVAKQSEDYFNQGMKKVLSQRGR